MPTADRYSRYRADQTTVWISKAAADLLARERLSPGEGVAAVLDRVLNDYRKLRRASGGSAPAKSAAKGASKSAAKGASKAAAKAPTRGATKGAAKTATRGAAKSATRGAAKSAAKGSGKRASKRTA